MLLMDNNNLKNHELENEFMTYVQTRLEVIAKCIDVIEKREINDKVENPQEALIHPQTYKRVMILY